MRARVRLGMGLVAIVGAACASASRPALPDADAGADAAARAIAEPAVADAGREAAPPLRVSVFSKTTGYRHPSIAPAHAMLAALGSDRGWRVAITEDDAAFTASLGDTDVAAFVLTTGEVLDDAQQAAFEAFVRRGGGFVGVHSATDTEYVWPFYQALVGAAFAGHPPGWPEGTLDVLDRAHPATAHLPARWTRIDEWYTFRTNPRDNPALRIVIALDEASVPIDPPWQLAGQHPLAWHHEHEGGRAFYTALGHTPESYAEPAFAAHVAGAVEWAGRRR
jgi:type 1 glutamine amidotransferase